MTDELIKEYETNINKMNESIKNDIELLEKILLIIKQ